MGRKHAKLSASGAYRWTECTNAPSLESKFPETSSKYADEGTLAHDLGELLLKLDLGRVSKKKAKYDIDVIKDNELYHPEMMEHCKDYRDFILEQYSEALAEDSDTQLFLEENLIVDNYIPEGFCTSDNIIVNSVKMRVNDLKYGKRDVQAEGNKQLRIYGLGAHNRFRKMYDYDTVQLSIFQPRLPGQIRTETISVYDLTKWGHTYLKPIAKIAFEGKEGEFVVGSHCKFCRAEHKCRALAEHNLDLIKYDFRIGDALDDEEIPEILVKGAQLVDWYNTVHKDALRQAVDNGKEWKDWKLVHGRGVRSYTDEQAVIKRLLAEGFTMREITNSKVKGITDMTKLLGPHGFETTLKGLIKKPRGAATLVPASDKREKYNSSISDFKDFLDD